MDGVAAGIYTIPGLKMGRSYLIDDRDGLTLIDTSSRTASSGILRAVASLGRPLHDLRLIVATHYHHDHTGNVQTLRDASGAGFAVHATEAPYVDGRMPWRAVRGLARFAPPAFALAVDRELQDGEMLPAAGGLQVIHAPGHTPGHIALYSAERRALFAGDAFMNVFGLSLPPSQSSHDMVAARRSIARLTTFDFDVALPGHGRAVLGNAREKLALWASKWL
jgi:glyoxylase-like metal-dependent hydrolase (beta-lactamase superfamily II)